MWHNPFFNVRGNIFKSIHQHRVKKKHYLTKSKLVEMPQRVLWQNYYENGKYFFLATRDKCIYREEDEKE